MTLPFLQPVTDLIVAALGIRLAPDVSDYLDLFADDGVLQTPFVPAGSQTEWCGKPAIEEFLSSLAGSMEQVSMNLTANLTTDRGAVLEYSGQVKHLDLGRSFHQDYVAVLELGDGRLTVFREYSNPLRVTEGVRSVGPPVAEPNPINPTRLHAPQPELDRLRARLHDTRWPDQETAAGWGQGVPSVELRRLCRYWAEGYDWRRLEDSFNAYDQFRTRIDGLDVHFIHARSGLPGARPLLMLHGWPGSVLDYLDVIPQLTRPAGGEHADAFDLVVPSLPGYGLSGHPSEAGWGVDRIAGVMIELMRRLEYDNYLVQGGDWGSVIATAIADTPDTRCTAVHLTTLTLQRPPTTSSKARAEVKRIARRRSGREKFGYAVVQSTRPQTLAYALADSPVGQAAWIYDKLFAWTEHDGDLPPVISDDQALDLITLYWLTNSAGSSARLYTESLDRADNSRRIRLPVAVSCFRPTSPASQKNTPSTGSRSCTTGAPPHEGATFLPWNNRISSPPRYAAHSPRPRSNGAGHDLLSHLHGEIAVTGATVTSAAPSLICCLLRCRPFGPLLQMLNFDGTSQFIVSVASGQEGPSLVLQP